MLSGLQRICSVLGDERAVMLAELCVVDGDRPAAASALQHGGALRMLGHSPNSG